MESRPLSEGNALQRGYARWAEPFYARMPPELREQAVLMDRFLYSRRGLGVWLGIAGAVAGTSFGLRGADMPWALAIALSLLLWVGLPAMMLVAWLQPGKFVFAEFRRKLVTIFSLALLGGLFGFIAGHVGRHGGLDLALLGQELSNKGKVLVPATLAAAAGMLVMMWGVARVRQELLERVQTERQAAEARLKLLQAQIQPHFIFNTLAALQHWVDSSDPRAGPLLRSLTAFLRGSTELLGQDRVTLGAEAETTHQYLQIMQARLGERLAFELQVAPDCAATVLPPGLVLTLVENAIEHGVSPALAGGHVQVSAKREGGAVVIRVRDDGLGLAPGWQDGTGLANCRERLRHHGDGRGTLDLHARQPGTEAVLTLPENTR
jgi:signal transduction histidine kinase